MTRRAVWWVAALSVGLGGCSRVEDPWRGEPGSPRVVVTIPPLYSFVKGVAGDRAAVKCLCVEQGPHHFNPDVSESLVLRQADLFFGVGLGLGDKFPDRLEGQRRHPELA